jgi:prepilin-type N-terminal cleavage/methylation domain-containing protein
LLHIKESVSRRNNEEESEGFSLIELPIVVAIILIIAAIAIPNLLRAKIAANQSSAVGSLRTIPQRKRHFHPPTAMVTRLPLRNWVVRRRRILLRKCSPDR